MKPGQAIENATCLQVAQVMRRSAGLTLDELALGMGKNRHTASCWFAEAAPDKFIPVPLVPLFCHVLRSPLLIEWQFAQYERLRRNEPLEAVAGDPRRANDLLLRGIVQASNAVALLRDMGDALTPSQARQCSGAILLAVATLVTAEREARGAAASTCDLRLCDAESDDELLAANSTKPTWRGRLRAWWREWTRPARLQRELEMSEMAKQACQADLAAVKRTMGAMGHLLREAATTLGPRHRNTVKRLLAEGRRLAESGAGHA